MEFKQINQSYLGILETNKPKISDAKLKDAFTSFLQKPDSYKHQFLQRNYQNAFDGYSFLGQTDSLNQYDRDLLHSFVLSGFHPVEKFPIEFRDFMNTEWNDIISLVKEIELNSIESLNIPGLVDIYKNSMGHMMSCNYYPKPIDCHSSIKNNERLSAHVDISLFSVFPFGNQSGFVYKNKSGQNIKLPNKNNVFLFLGYFLEKLTSKKLEALEHKVELPSNIHTDRFSFAIFSIPKPENNIAFSGRTFTSEAYFQEYLSLF